jgi:hypothetical protein
VVNFVFKKIVLYSHTVFVFYVHVSDVHSCIMWTFSLYVGYAHSLDG